MSMQVLNAFQGRQYNRILQINNTATGLPATGVFTSASVLSANVWEGQNQASLFQPTVSWATTLPTIPPTTQTGYDQGQVSLSIAAAQTIGLDPGGEYYLLIDETTGGVTAPVIQCRLKILATPGGAVIAPPDLITYDLCLSQLSVLGLTDDQLDLLPVLITAASQAVRLECNDRYFDLRTLTEWHEVELDGYCRLWQEPIQIITRVQGVPQLALTVSNTSADVAQAYFSYTGYDGGYNANAKTATGIVLNSITSGVPSTQTVSYTSDETVSQLAAAINAVGNGWQAQVDSSFGNWAVTELTGGFVAQGCAANALPSVGAQFNVLTDLADAQLRPRSPMLYVGRQRGGNVLAGQWGPGGQQMFGDDSRTDLGLVKVTYIAGFTTIPPDVQFQTAQLVKWKLELGVQELLLKAESAAEYKYNLAEDMVHAMPRPVREALGKGWKYHYA
jgi:hypothetical protein